MTLNDEGEIEAAARNYRRPLRVPSAGRLVIRNFGTVDVRVELRIPRAVTLPGRRRIGRVSIEPCEDGEFQCVSAIALTDQTVAFGSEAMGVYETSDVTLTVRPLIGLSITSTGYLQLQANASLVRVAPPPPPRDEAPDLLATLGARRSVGADAETKDKGCTAATSTNQDPPTSLIELAGDASFNRIPDFDRNNDGEELINADNVFGGGYANLLKARGTIQFVRSNDTIEGNVKVLYQDSAFGGLDGRLQPNRAQSSLVKTTPVSRVDDPLTIDTWSFKITPRPTWFMQIGRMAFRTPPNNVAGSESGEGIRFSMTPGCDKALTLEPGYVIGREGLNGIPDEHQRDAEVLSLDAAYDTSKRKGWHFGPRFRAGIRRGWDRGRDVDSKIAELVFDPKVHSFYGTQTRWTAGIQYIQPLPHDSTARVAFYRSRLRGNDVEATLARQDGRGSVVFASYIPPEWGGQWTVFAMRGSADDPATALLNEGFLGNAQRTFKETTNDTDPDIDSIFFDRIVGAMEARRIDAALFSASGLSNKTYAGASWNRELTVKKPADDSPTALPPNPLRVMIWRVKYRAIWQRDLGDLSGFAGHELALRVVGTGDTGTGVTGKWTPYAAVVYFQRGPALSRLIEPGAVWQVVVGASVNIPLFKRLDGK